MKSETIYAVVFVNAFVNAEYEYTVCLVFLEFLP